MSSTNRGGDRNKDDYYYTPLQTIRDFWFKFCQTEGVSIEDFKMILDPCAGGDDKRDCAYPLALIDTDDRIGFSRFLTIDIRNDSRALHKEDYLLKSYGMHELIISNPPYSLFELFLVKALKEIEPNGYVIFLLRLNAAGGQKRRVEFWDKFMPKSIYVHSKRPCFMKGGSDSCEYAHFVWQNGYIGETTFHWV